MISSVLQYFAFCEIHQHATTCRFELSDILLVTITDIVIERVRSVLSERVSSRTQGTSERLVSMTLIKALRTRSKVSH